MRQLAMGNTLHPHVVMLFARWQEKGIWPL